MEQKSTLDNPDKQLAKRYFQYGCVIDFGPIGLWKLHCQSRKTVARRYPENAAANYYYCINR